MLGEANKYGLVRFDSGGLRSDAGERIAQRSLRVGWELGDLRLKCSGGRDSGLARADISETSQRAENFENFFFGNFAGTKRSSLAGRSSVAGRTAFSDSHGDVNRLG